MLTRRAAAVTLVERAGIAVIGATGSGGLLNVCGAIGASAGARLGDIAFACSGPADRASIPRGVGAHAGRVAKIERAGVAFVGAGVALRLWLAELIAAVTIDQVPVVTLLAGLEDAIAAAGTQVGEDIRDAVEIVAG
jgi:hypothetical protein